MLKITRLCFLVVAVMESLLILWDAGTVEVMLSSVWSLEEVRIVLVVVSLLCAAALSLVAPSDA